MKRLAFLLAAFFPFSAARAAETVAVVVAGRALDPIPSYQSGGEQYLDAKRVGGIYGGQVYWYPVSGRVQLSLRGRTLQFVVDSTKALAGDETFTLAAPTIVRASRAFIPTSLLLSESFARWSGFDARWDSATRTLQVERRTTVGPVQSFSYKGRTRVVLALAPGVAREVSVRGVRALDVVVPFGVVEGAERVDVDDGVVASYSVKQEARAARVTVRFALSGARWTATELADPRRLAVDVYAPNGAPGAPTKARRRVIVIDAGHGGKDPGATGTRGTQEKDVTLAAALELARVLRERGDFDVALTRAEDIFVPLSERSKKANDLEADLFVSLHCNAARNRRERGFEVYSVSETASDPEAERLASVENSALEFEGKNPQDETAKGILLAMTKTEMVNESAPFAALVERSVGKRVDVPNRGQKQAGFYVLRGTHAPAILVEMAFVSDPKDEAELGSRRFRRKMVEGIAAGIGDYARKEGWLE